MTPLAAAGLVALLTVAQADAKPRMTDLKVLPQGSRIEVSFALVDAFDQELVERIETGLPSGFDYQFRLQRDRKWWFDAGMRSTTLEVFATYDAVNGEYLVNFRQDGRLIESRVLRNLAELERAMTRFDGLFLFTAERRPDRRLIVRARARLGSKNVLGFIPATVATDWVESSKFRLPEPGR